MIVKEYVYNVKCDCCKCLRDEECWYPDEYLARQIDDGWLTLGGKDYCPDCWSFDDEDDIVTKDGRKWDGGTYEEIKNG